MSSKCTNCDCADATQCPKKGYAPELIKTDERSMENEGMAMDAPAAPEHNGKCTCGANCSCTTCTCGH
ncbi:metallothionein-like protein type 3 [Andrographis paniculata]|uniref:metallothionein-like protein type 3 n=1 Tax=Andrographis paniculata TaxID=175694 RepID=UPI0021E7D131|nr:metallothionein-like protein type 3 [Andrographis paniculata]